MDQLGIYALLDLAGIDYDEFTIRKGDVTCSYRPLKFPPCTYKYVQSGINWDLFSTGEEAWEILESINGGEYKLIIRTMTKDIKAFYKDYPPAIVVPLKDNNNENT